MAFINSNYRWRGAVEPASNTSTTGNNYLRWRGAVEPLVPSVFLTGDAQTFAAEEIGDFFAVGTLFSSDLATWFDLDMGFAESVFVGATELAGIFDNDSMTGATMDGPRVLIKTSDIDDNSIDQGTVLTIRSRTFHVGGVQRDGVGVSTVILHEPV